MATGRGGPKRSPGAGPRGARRAWLGAGLVAAGLAAGLWWLLQPAPPPALKPPAPPRVVVAETPAPDAGAPPDAALAPAVPASTASSVAQGYRPRNREEAALAVAGAKRRVVVDVKSIAASGMGQALLRCLPRSDRQGLRGFRAAGFDPLTRFEKVVVAGEVPVVFGALGGYDWSQLPDMKPHTRKPLGADAVRYSPVLDPEIYGHLPPEEQPEFGSFVVWNEQAILGAGASRAEQEALLARLRGGWAAADAAPPLTTAGEIHGEAPASELLEALPVPYEVRRPLMDMLDSLNVRVRFEVDVGDTAEVRVSLAGAGALVEEAVGAAVESLRNAPLSGDDAEGLDDTGGGDTQTATVRSLMQGLEVGRDKRGMRVGLRITQAHLRGLLGACVDEGHVPGSPEDLEAAEAEEAEEAARMEEIEERILRDAARPPEGQEAEAAEAAPMDPTPDLPPPVVLEE